MSEYEGYINSELTKLRKQNNALREQLAAKGKAYDVLAIHMAEVKALSDGNSTNTLKDIVDHCIEEIVALGEGE